MTTMSLEDLAYERATKYGNLFYTIKTDLSESGVIVLFADEAEVTPDGSLLFWRKKDGVPEITLAVACGHWSAFFATSCLDHVPVAVSYWPEEVPVK